MITVTLTDHPECLTRAALEFAAERVAAADRMVAKIGKDRAPGESSTRFQDTARRRMATRAIDTAIRQLEAARAVLAAGAQ